MLYAIFSDIHSNLEGLEAVLREADSTGADALLCCGDIIGYNANPNECVDLVRERGVSCIKGNHERGLMELERGESPNMNPVAMEALEFTMQALSDERKDWLYSLPDQLAVEDFCYLFHGSPSHPDEYIFDSFEAAYAFKSLEHDYSSPVNQLCFIGHTHICAAYVFLSENRRVGEGRVHDGAEFTMKPGAYYMFNTGSCGQYRGGLAIATMVLLDTDHMNIKFRFLDYDYQTTQEKIVAAGLPPFLAQRLGAGQ